MLCVHYIDNSLCTYALCIVCECIHACIVVWVWCVCVATYEMVVVLFNIVVWCVVSQYNIILMYVTDHNFTISSFMKQ